MALKTYFFLVPQRIPNKGCFFCQSSNLFCSLAHHMLYVLFLHQIGILLYHCPNSIHPKASCSFCPMINHRVSLRKVNLASCPKLPNPATAATFNPTAPHQREGSTQSQVVPPPPSSSSYVPPPTPAAALTKKMRMR